MKLLFFFLKERESNMPHFFTFVVLGCPSYLNFPLETQAELLMF